MSDKSEACPIHCVQVRIDLSDPDAVYLKSYFVFPGLRGVVYYNPKADAAEIRVAGKDSVLVADADLCPFSNYDQWAFTIGRATYLVQFKKITSYIMKPQESPNIPRGQYCVEVEIDVSNPSSIYGHGDFYFGRGLRGRVRYSVKQDLMSVVVCDGSGEVASSSQLKLSMTNSFSFVERGQNHVVYFTRVGAVQPTIEQRLSRVEKQLAKLLPT